MNPRPNPKPKTRAKTATTTVSKPLASRAGKKAGSELPLLNLSGGTPWKSGEKEAFLAAMRRAPREELRPLGKLLGISAEQVQRLRADVQLRRGITVKAMADLSASRPKTMRLEPLNEEGLALLKDALGVPMNKMVNEAVGEYVQRRTKSLEATLSGALERVKAHRRADPTFAKDLAEFVSSEAKHGAKDPLEGETYDVTPPARKKASTKATKATKDESALTKVRGILRG